MKQNKTRQIASTISWVVGVVLFFIIVIQTTARVSFYLSGLRKENVSDQVYHDAATFHKVAELSGKIYFRQSPMLDELTKSGKLPQVVNRLPENPQVIIPPTQHGPYGGTWRRFGTELADIQPYIAHRIPYGNILRWSPQADKLLPNLASKWDVSADNKIVTVYLRRGVKWSDGEPFTTDDILFWYNDVLQNEDLTPAIPREYKRGGKLMQLQVIDKYTVKFIFAVPFGRFEQLLAGMPGTDMIDCPAHYLRKFHPNYTPAKELDKMAREKGFDFWYQLFADARDWTNPDHPRLWPWVVVQPPPARPIILTRNPYYWKVDDKGNQLPYIDKITFEIFDAETINLKAINGEIGLQDRHIKFENHPLLKEHAQKGGYHLLYWHDSNGGVNVIALNLNSKDPEKNVVFNNRTFRIAMSQAIDRDAINKVCYFGQATPRQVSPPKSSPYYDAEYEKIYTDFLPDKANMMLDEMGLSKKDSSGFRLLPSGKPLSITIEANGMACNPTALQMVADNWNAVGVKTDIKLEARQLFYQRKDAMLHDAAVWYGADEQMPVLDPRWFFPYSKESNQAPGYATWFRSGGKKGIKPPADIQKCMDLYTQIDTTSNEKEQRKLFQQIIDLNKKNLWVIGTVGEVPSLFVINNNFRNVPAVGINGWQFRGGGNTAPECYAIDGGSK
jgi:peptide/nickel transport system substrate-binding protein